MEYAQIRLINAHTDVTRAARGFTSSNWLKIWLERLCKAHNYVKAA